MSVSFIAAAAVEEVVVHVGVGEGEVDVAVVIVPGAPDYGGGGGFWGACSPISDFFRRTFQ